jgi:hypothetical protein
MSRNFPIGGQEESELWRLAQEALVEHGAGAPAFAGEKAVALLRQGDADGTHIWCIVARRAGILIERATRTPN